jgi:hypothetical protein
LEETFKFKDVKSARNEWLKKELMKLEKNSSEGVDSIANCCIKLYEKGYNGLDIIHLVDNRKCFPHLSDKTRYELLFAFNKIRKEFRNEKILIMFILNFLFLDKTTNLENISFI